MTSPVQEQMRWYVEAMDRAGRGDVDPAEIRAHWANPFDNTDDEEISWWKREAARNQGLTIVSVEETSPHAAVFVVDEGRGRSHRVTIEVEPEPPHRFTRWRWRRNHPFELKIREAGPADAEALDHICREAAIVIGETSTRTEFFGDYFAQTRLIAEGDVKVLIADVDDEPAAFAWAVKHPGMVNGVLRDLNYFLHLRVLPEHQKKGLWGELNGAVYEAFPEVEYKYGTFTPENVAWSHVSEVRAAPHPGLWRHAVHRFQLPAQPGHAVGRPATPDDASRLAELINALHDREELFVPYTAESLTARVERAPDLYGWDRIWIEGDAVIGAWPAGHHARVVTTRPGETIESRRAHVLDYGCAPGSEEHLLALIGSRRAALADEGLTDLSILCCEASRLFGPLRDLAAQDDRFVMVMNPHGQEPKTLNETGLCFDHLYF